MHSLRYHPTGYGWGFDHQLPHSLQSLQQWSKSRTSLADTDTASWATFHNVLPFLSNFSYLGPRSYFTSRTPNKDQKIEQLFYFLGDIHELHGEHFYACHSHNMSRFNHHSVALVLLYNMSLERNFSIERFQVMQHQNIRKSQYNHVVFLHVPCLTMG